MQHPKIQLRPLWKFVWSGITSTPIYLILGHKKAVQPASLLVSWFLFLRFVYFNILSSQNKYTQSHIHNRQHSRYKPPQMSVLAGYCFPFLVKNEFSFCMFTLHNMVFGFNNFGSKPKSKQQTWAYNDVIISYPLFVFYGYVCMWCLYGLNVCKLPAIIINP